MVTGLEAVAGRALPEPSGPEQVLRGQPWPLAACRHDDVAAVLLLRRRNEEELAISVEVLQLRGGKWDHLAEADDEWDRGPPGSEANAPAASIAWLADGHWAERG